MIQLSIIIVNWNVCDLLRGTLESVYANPSEFVTEVVVVDNASSDGSVEMVRRRFPQVRLIANQENVGFARANNQAIRQSQGKYVLLLNPDTRVEPDALAGLVHFMEMEPEAGIVGATLRDDNGMPQPCFGRFPTLLSETVAAWGLEQLWPFSSQYRSLAAASDVLETDWVLGAALLVRRNVLDEVGVLDEGFFMYGEEIDLARRVKAAGWKVYTLGKARIVHLGGQSSKQVQPQMKAMLFRSKLRYFEKYHGLRQAALLRLAFSSSMRAKQWAYGAVGEHSRAEMWRATRACFEQGPNYSRARRTAAPPDSVTKYS